MAILLHSDQVEEVFVQDLDEFGIVNWLKTNFAERNFEGLRKKYEPIWSSHSLKTMVAVANFGQSTQNLKELYFRENDDLLKASILRNPFFGEVLHTRHGIGKDEIIKLYRQKDPFRGLFHDIFLNPNIDPDFVADVFSGEFYKQIPQQDLVIILECIVDYAKDGDGKSPLDVWVELQRDTHRRGLSKIVEFIANFVPELDKQYFSATFIFSDTLEIISDTRLNCSFGVDVIRKYHPDNLLPSDYTSLSYDDTKDSLFYIRNWFANLRFKRSHLSQNSLLYSEFKNSEHAWERSFYSRYSSIRDLFDVKGFFRMGDLPRIDDLIWDSDVEGESDLAKYSPQNGLRIRNGLVNEKGITEYKAFQKKLLKDQAYFVASIALNNEFYQDSERRAWLKALCERADDEYFLEPSFTIFGNGTCMEVFEGKEIELKKEHPEFFADTSIENRIINLNTKLDALSLDTSISKEIFNYVRQSNETVLAIKIQQENFEEKINDNLKEIKRIQDNTRNQVYQLWIDKNIPNDLLARLVFKIPLIGHFLKSLLR